MKKKIDLKARYLKLAKVVGVLVILSSLVYVVLLLMSNKTLAAAYQALEDAGRPMQGEQVIPAAVADVDNAALVYQAVALQLRSEAVGKDNLLDRGSQLGQYILDGDATDEQRQDWAELVKTPILIGVVETLEKGARKPSCWYDLDYTDGAGTLLPHLSENRALSRILGALAITQAKAGNHDQAWHQLASGLRIADGLRNEPFLISQLVRIAQFGVTVDAMEQVAEIAPPTLEQAAEMDGLLESFEGLEPFERALDGERLLLGEWAFNLPRDRFVDLADGSGKDALPLSLYAACKPLFQRDHAAYLTLMHAYSEKATTPYSSDDAGYGEAMMTATPRYCILTRMLVPALSAAKVKFLVVQAHARMARIGLQITQHRGADGTYPASLGEFGGEDMLDPFTQKAFVYKPSKSGYMLYSIGKNGVDDGGKNDLKEGDVVWSIGEGEEEK